jgi:hypothetical protein
VFAHHIALDAPERGDDGADLVRDVHAVALVLDHLLQAPNLAFNALKARQLPSVIWLRTSVSLFRLNH